MLLTKREAAVLERLRVGGKYTEIGDTLGMTHRVVATIVQQLASKSAVEVLGSKRDRRYKVRVHDYQVVERIIVEKPEKVPTRPLKVQISDEDKLYIEGHYKIKSRRELARRLGYSKIHLNQALIQLGIGR